MPIPAIILSLLFFPSLLAANVILLWAFRETKKAGVWPTEKFFGFEIRRPFQLLFVVKRLRQELRDTRDPVESRRYRQWLTLILLGYGLGAFAFAVLIVFLPWL